MEDCDPVPALRRILLEALGLKALPRTGWVRTGVDRPESVAAHAWGVAWLVLVLCPAGLDRGHALALALVHDLAEVRTGDPTPGEIPPAVKTRMEREGLTGLVSDLPGAMELLALWEEFEAGATPEARFVRACDRLDMALQATRYAKEQDLDLAEFVDAALATLDDPVLRALAAGQAPDQR